MIHFYPQIKLVHVVAVLASGGLFFVRGLALHLGQKWPMTAPVRYLSYTIDTVLLAAALVLTAILHQYPFVRSWLTVKVVLLVVYIALGTFALKRGQTLRARVICWLAALAVYAFIISVARAHHPAGALRPFACGLGAYGERARGVGRGAWARDKSRARRTTKITKKHSKEKRRSSFFCYVFFVFFVVALVHFRHLSGPSPKPHAPSP